MVQPRRIADFKPTLSKLATTSHYQVIFGGLPSPLRQHLNVRDVGWRFTAETIGLLCNNAVLPGSSVATGELDGHYMGIKEKFAHSRMFMDISLEFYVDSDYKTIKFFEHWIEFMASGSQANQADDGYFIRMAYPDEYKTSQTKIIKFDKDYNSELEYTFYGLFPRQLNDMSVSYDQSDILRATCSFTYDRYICGKNTSFSIFRGNNNNRKLTGSNFNIPFLNNFR